MKNVSNKLRVAHMPQVPGKSFYIHVENELEAAKIIAILAQQHLWLYNNNYIPDFSNMISVEMFNEETQEWENYCNEEEDYAEWDEIEESLQYEIEYLELSNNFV